MTSHWIVQCLTSPPTQYRLYGRRFLQVEIPNQQYQSTEGSYKRQIKQRKQHICLAKVGVSLQHAISHEFRISFWRVQGTYRCIYAVVSCIMWWNLRQFNIKQLFIHKPDSVRSPLMRDNVTAIECCGRLMQIHILCQREKQIFWA